MDPVTGVSSPDPFASDVERGIGRAVLRLVKGGPERRAIAAGEVDAILDPGSGSVYLLPGAQRWLLERIARERRQAASPRTNAPDGTALDWLACQVAVLDAAGIVLLANQAWRNERRSGLGAQVTEGHDYLAACDRASGPDRLDGMALAAGIRQVIAGERKQFCYERAGDLAGRRWITFNVTRATGDRDGRAIVARDDITDRTRGELLLALENRVAGCLLEATDTGAGLQAVIHAVCDSMGWECGRYFRLDAANAVMHCQESWGISTPAVEQFLSRSRGLALPVGVGSKGRVSRSGQPLWTVSEAPGTGGSPSALAPETDTQGAFIFPVASEYRTIGVLAFSGGVVRKPDDRMLQAVRTIGSQLGRFVQRQQALDGLRRNEARFRRLTELSTDWCWEQDRDFRFVRHTGAAEVLGANDVLGKMLWELPNVVPDSADWASHRAQLAERWSFHGFEFTVIQADGRVAYYCISGEPIFDEAGAFTGYWGTGMDITQRKRAEIALRESEADLRARVAPATASQA